ncbi:3-isopropylmalate/(R)-2-methylmalate dehydratase small subunit [Hymenobacter gelipurpurascens]|uniref:3-isopropylmalate dehydratase small subunit n=1 Tax=Hymenobacter gelipurpurascens TaxID=89968 RepID=A0A212T0K8_9BACT|nr:3-isopropylmalate dehydratase small subunit [Hymenobacter gelipurpurascens]SNC59567.1 3-isopropylmalate/(R)-2-methylmalate dehydratase small subunit [Hymenobacter gelipurpurascens]
MEKFQTLRSGVVPLPIENVDTDQIIPARFLKATTREGFGENLFADWRYTADGQPKPDFVLNDARYVGHQILLAGKNFGCGSSREHAAWALYDARFRVVISSYFADIFRGNALNTGLLPLQVSDEVLLGLFEVVAQNPQAALTVDLQAQTLTVPGRNEVIHFDLDLYKKECLINGYDDIDFLISQEAAITAYEQQRSWVF